MLSADCVKERLLAQAQNVCAHLLPDGSVRGTQFRIGGLNGERGSSLSINLNTGAWLDHATGDKGGNLLDLWCRVRGIDFKMALHQASGWLGGHDAHDTHFQGLPKKTTMPKEAFDWSRHVCPLTETTLRDLAHWRGYSADLLLALSKRQLIGWIPGRNAVALPVHDEKGRIINAHCRLRGEKTHSYLVSGQQSTPLVVGDLATADTVRVHESPWDLFADLEAHGWHNGGGDRIAFIGTRGASNGKRIGGLVREGQMVVLILQNDPPRNGKQSASERWLADAVASLPDGVTAYRLAPPPEFEDWQAWLKAVGAERFPELAHGIMPMLVDRDEEVDGLTAHGVPEAASHDAHATHFRSSPKNSERAPFDAYYDSDRKEYLIQNDGGRWITQTSAQMRRRLKLCGGEAISPDRFLLDTEDKFDVRYAAPLAGQTAGFYQEGPLRILVTESPSLIRPEPGEWPKLRDVIEGLFKKGEDPTVGQLQLDTFLSWLKASVESLRAGTRQHQQALAIAGPVSCGKSLLQHLITHFLGGRGAKSHQFMTGATDFNAELFEAEHLMLEDEYMSKRGADRARLGAAIKNVTVSTELQSCHRKNRTPVQLRPWWRLSITLNSNPESMRVLPPLTEDMADKIIILRASRFRMPIQTDDAGGRERLLSSLKSEIPAFLHWLNQYTIPGDLRDGRYLVKTYHHPELVRELNALSPEESLLGLADCLLWERCDLKWEGTAEDLRRMLLDAPSTRREAEALLDWSSATGTFLGRLADRPEPRVFRDRSMNLRRWRIERPA
jgi:hypothetical protein